MNTTATTALFTAYVALENAAEGIYGGEDLTRAYSTSILYFTARGYITRAAELVLDLADDLETAADDTDADDAAQECVTTAVRDARAAL